MNAFLKKIKPFVPALIIKGYESYLRNKEIKENEGDNYFCPICKSSFNRMNFFGDPPRENAMCFKCGSLERHRLLYWYFVECLNLFSSKKKCSILHFAPEKMLSLPLNARFGKDYYPADLFPEKEAFTYLPYVHSVDITRISFEKDFFDLIICSHVLEHIPDDKKAISELYRVLKPRGILLVMVPMDKKRFETYEDATITSFEARKKYFGQEDHVRLYGMNIQNRFDPSIWHITYDTEAMGLSLADRRKMSIPDQDVLFVCTKLESIDEFGNSSTIS